MLSIVNYSNSVIEKTYGILKRAFNKAVLNKIIISSPFYTNGLIVKPKSSNETKKIEAFSIEEQTKKWQLCNKKFKGKLKQ